MMRVFMARRSPMAVDATSVEYEIEDGEELPFAGGIRALHTSGHSAGHLAFLWPKSGGGLFAADAASNLFGLGYSIIYEDLRQGERSLARLAGLDFEHAVFGHGRPILGGASQRFKERWGAGGPAGA